MKIKTLCYGSIKEFNSIKEAKDFYLDCYYGSEGCERERYSNILMGILDGQKFVYDDEYEYQMWKRNKEEFSYDS